MNIGPPNTFPSSRELPPLNAGRSSSASGGMSISAMLGNSAAASGPREPTPGAHHPSFTAPPATSAAASGPTYAGSVHASPRMPASSAEYHPYPRRPQTPDQGRPYDARDHRGTSDGDNDEQRIVYLIQTADEPAPQEIADSLRRHSGQLQDFLTAIMGGRVLREPFWLSLGRLFAESGPRVKLMLA